MVTLVYQMENTVDYHYYRKEYENLQQTSHQVKRHMFDIAIGTITITCMKIRSTFDSI
jgi:hypothetical protein